MQFETGDLLFFWGTDRLSRFIRAGTWGPSHVGMVVTFDPEGPLLVESTTLLDTPCRVKGKRIAGVQANDIDARIRQYTANGGKVEVWRLTPKNRLFGWQKDYLATYAYHRYLGKPYDTRQAIGSGANVAKWWLKKRFGWAGVGAEDRTKFFCAELSICQLQDIGLFLTDLSWSGLRFEVNPSDYSPAEFRRAIRSEGLYWREEIIRG